jgi:dihydropteroate synthase
MGVLNVTPDSFSDGGRYVDPDDAIEHGLAMLRAGADLIDVGGESTRPRSLPIDPVEEQRRVLPIVAALAAHGRVSIDTRNASTAEAAIEAGATLVNDVSAALWPVAAANGAGWIAMHMLGDPTTVQQHPAYDDVVVEVRDFLVRRAEKAVAAGVDEVWLDPGFGFGKTLRHNLDLLANLDRLVATGFPVCVGLSRKSFLGRVVAAADAEHDQPTLPGLTAPNPADHTPPVPADDRLEGSVAAATWALIRGARMIRVHEVAPSVAAARLVAA